MTPSTRFDNISSESAIHLARDRSRAEGVSNVAFQVADAQVHRLLPESFNLAISRFGTMFFDDPIAAFVNIGRALRPGGRLVMMVWQGPERNEWEVEIRRSLEETDESGELPPPGPDPFSLADPTTMERILEAAGFDEVAFSDVHEPVFYGSDVATALNWVRGFTYAERVLGRLDPPAVEPAIDRLRAMLATHARPDGVWFDSRAWIVTARRQGRSPR